MFSAKHFDKHFCFSLGFIALSGFAAYPAIWQNRNPAIAGFTLPD
jgi:hypothetical protein